MKNNSHQDLVSNQRNVYNVIYETNYRTWRKSYMDLTKLTAYEIIEHRPLPDLKSEGALLRHKKSGARVLLISNDDENKVFNIGFRTPTTIVASCAPTRLLIWELAHSPNAVDPPALFIRQTMVPKITRKIRIPTL